MLFLEAEPMEEAGNPHITSFVIRFVQEGGDASPGAGYRGNILHVQTDEQMAFTHWEDAVNFIRRFMTLEHQGMEDQDIENLGSPARPPSQKTQ
jgi:hypothetical protein